MKVRQAGGHIDQLLRQTRVHHMHLSQMADFKANMLLTVSMLVITFTAPHVLNAALRVPAIIVCGSCLATVMLAAYAVMPKVRDPRRKAKIDVDAPGYNLLFFGDFSRLSYEEFEQAMERVVNDESAVYRQSIREIYTMGVFLARQKYRYIRLAYLVFIGGLLASAAALLVVTLMA
jgi:hypothetical protein